jgi:flavin reductase (DIM6/NTAB) family NADH-FMN oxidoreductase RutF
MNNSFSPLSPFLLTDNVFKLLHKDWMLITAGTPDNFNTMTASWGGFGVLWNKPVAFLFIRPTRYTFEFSEKCDIITLSFFKEEHRNALNICGSCSGKDLDKVKKAGITPITTDNGGVSFAEARLFMDCNILTFSDIDPTHFRIPDIDRHYPLKDYHRMYMSEIISCYSNAI